MMESPLVPENIRLSIEQITDPDMIIEKHTVPSASLGNFGQLSSTINPRGKVGQNYFLFAGAFPDDKRYLMLGGVKIHLPDLDDDNITFGSYALIGTYFYLFSSNRRSGWMYNPDTKTSIWQPSLSCPTLRKYSVLNGVAILISKTEFGDTACVTSDMIRLKNERLLLLWYRNSDVSITNNKAGVGVAIFDPQTGDIVNCLSQIYVDNVPTYGTGQVVVTGIQHPVDHSIWIFTKGDSFASIWAIHLQSDLSLDWIDSSFLNSLDGGNAPSGEFPCLIADADSDFIYLAYQNEQFKFFQLTPKFVKGAYVSIAKISPDKLKSFINFNTYVERVWGLGMIVSDKIYLVYRPINEINHYLDVAESSWDGREWSSSVVLGTTNLLDDVVAFGKPSCFGFTSDGNTIHIKSKA